MQEIQSKYSIDLTDFFEQMEKAGQVYAAFDERVKQSRAVGNSRIQEAAQMHQRFNQQLGQQIQVYMRVEAAENSLLVARKRLENQLKDLKSRQMEFIAAGRYSELRTEIERVRAKLKEMNSPLVETNSLWDKLKAKFSGGLKVPKVEVPNAPTGNNTPSAGGRSTGGGLKGAVGGAADELLGVAGVSLSTAGAVAAAGAIVVKSTKEWAEYGKKLSEVSAITGTTGKALEFLDDQALQIEADTGIAGTTILDAFKNIGSIKPEILENADLLAQTTKEVIALSQAAGIDLTQAAQATLGALNQFGESADQAGRFVNVLAAGALKGSSEIDETAAALQNSGTAMKAAGLSFEQGNALIQSLAKVMIKGSEAGTGLRNVLLKLETSADKNLRPSVVGLDAALDNASKKFNSTTELTKAFGVENIVAARQVIENRDEITKMTTAITGTSVAYEQARKNTDNLATDLDKAGTSISSFFRSLGSSQDGYLRKSIQLFTSFLNSLSSKRGELRAFFSEFFTLQTLFDPAGSIANGIASGTVAALKQRQANLKADARKAEVDGIQAAATTSVRNETAEAVKQFKDKGELEPKAYRDAAAKVKAARDEEYNQARADHNRIRKEYERAGANEKAVYDKRFAESRKRILSTQTAKKLADSEAARLTKQDTDQATALKKALGEPAPAAKKKNDDSALKATQEQNRILLDAQKEYQQELSKLESQYSKEQLEALDKNSVEYITRKAQLDRDEIKAERDHLTELYRIKEAKTTRVNPLTNKREAVIDPTLQLPQASQDIYDNRSAAVTAEANRKIEELRYQNSLRLLQITRQFDKLEVEEVRKKWEDIIKAEIAGFVGTADARTKLEAELRTQQQADIERTKISQAITQIRSQEELSLAYVNSAEVDRDLKLQKYTKDQTLNIEKEKEKEKMRLKIRIESGEKLIAYLEAQGAKENALLIRNAKNEVDAAKKSQKDLETTKLDYSSGAGFFGSLLGLEGEDLDKFKKATDAIGAAIQQVTAAQIEASEKRIAAIDAEIQAKEEQIKIEEERSKDGFANNLKLREEELQNLKAQKAQEEAVRRKAVKTQQELDLISSTSANIATTADLIGSAAKAFRVYSGIPFVGIALAIASAAAIYATIVSFKAKAKALTALRDGGRIPLSGRTHEQGGHRIEGTDIEVERGEHVTNARSSEKYDAVLEAINQDDPRKVFQAMIRQFSFGLPTVIVQQLQRPDFGRGVPALDTSRLEKQVVGMTVQVAGMATEIREMAAHIANLPTSQVVSLGDGRVLERDKGRTVITEHGKK